MIGYLRGTLIASHKDKIWLDVNGVGYELIMPGKWLVKHTGQIGSNFTLFTYTVVRENELYLIGFENLDERLLFSRLLKVPSVGPKTALVILSQNSVSAIEEAVEKQNIDFFLAIKGLAKKTAQKVVIELRSQFKALAAEKEQTERQEMEEFYEVLGSMGFSSSEIRQTAKKINKKESLDNQIKQALRLLSK
jgi:Holliday junction DNA helicase RuvA